MNYCILKSDPVLLLVMGGCFNHRHNFGYFDAMLSCHFLELLSPMLKILGDGSIESSLALFSLCRGNLVCGLLACGEFALWLSEGLDLFRGVPFGPGGAVSQWN